MQFLHFVHCVDDSIFYNLCRNWYLFCLLQFNLFIINIGYVTFKKIVNCNSINSVNPLYLMNNEMIGSFEEKSGNKYLVLGDVKIKEF